MQTHMRRVTFDTPLGRCALSWHDAGLTGFELPEASPRPTDDSAPPAEILQVIERVRLHLSGRFQDFSDLRYDFSNLSRLQPRRPSRNPAYPPRRYDDLRRHRRRARPVRRREPRRRHRPRRQPLAAPHPLPPRRRRRRTHDRLLRPRRHPHENPPARPRGRPAVVRITGKRAPHLLPPRADKKRDR